MILKKKGVYVDKSDSEVTNYQYILYIISSMLTLDEHINGIYKLSDDRIKREVKDILIRLEYLLNKCNLSIEDCLS